MNVPQLRFDGFYGEWEETFVKDTFSEVRNGFVGTATPFYVEEGIPYLQSNNVKNNKINKKKMVYINEEFHKKNKKSILRKSDIVMVQSGHAGECAVIEEEFAGANCHALIVMTPNSKTNAHFFSYYINSPLGQKKLYKLITGNTIRHILASDIKKYAIKMPGKEEQLKISSFFSLLERKIEKQQEKIEKLEQFKKGMMQKIFSQELRFKDEDGGEFPEWKLTKMKEVTKKVGPRNKSDQKLPIYSINNKKGFLLQNEQFESSRLEDLEKTSYKIVRPNQFAYNPSRINVGSIGHLKTDFPVLISSLYVCFETKNNVDSLFMEQYVSSYNFNKEVAKNTEGSVREYLFYENFSNIRFPKPFLKEQQKIAGYFNSLDFKIQKEEEKLMVLEEQKNGFMNEMFI